MKVSGKGLEMELIQLTILSLVQGLTEFLPISSSAHLILVSSFMKWPDQGLTTDIFAHFGTLIAVIFYFRRELKEIIKSDDIAIALFDDELTPMQQRHIENYLQV